MAVVLSLIIDKRRKTKKETYPICFFLSCAANRSYIRIPDGPKVDDKYWDGPSMHITKGCPIHPSPGHWNHFLQEKLAEKQKILDKERFEGTLESMTHEQVKSLIMVGKPMQVSFTDYLDGLIDQFDTSGNFGQKTVYTQAKRFIARYGDLGEGGYTFSQVNYRLMRLMTERYKPRIEGNLNGLGICLRTIRAVWNRAINEGVTTRDAYPFDKYKIKKSQTHKSAITEKDFERIIQMKLPVDSKGWHARNLFLFSFLCRGMNFADIAALTYANIIDGRIVYTRKKVKKPLTIKISDAITNVLSQYPTENARPADYLFPVISPDRDMLPAAQAREYHTAVNHALKRIAKALGLHQSLSFNTARHSWATIGRNMDLPIGVISQGLGHTDIQTTQIYLDAFDTEKMDAAEALIGGGLSLSALKNTDKP